MQSAAIIVVLNISSAMPPAIFPMMFAEAGATKNTSAFLARDICLMSNSKFLSKVSTIHLLDVYKRQEHESDLIRNAIEFDDLEASEICTPRTNIAVSYTHLDVYKRQVYILFCFGV